MTDQHLRLHRTHAQRGVALISALLLLLLMSALAVAVLIKVNTDQRLQKTDSGNNLAYYGAEAGMEKLTADLGDLYAHNAAPTWCDITALESQFPAFADVGVTYTPLGYRITVLPDPPGRPTTCTAPDWRVQTISQGPNAGLYAQIVPLTLQVTADRPGGEEVSMQRQVEVALIPVFQFGVFSESDLSFFPGPVFDFNGRTQTNGNLFLAAQGTLTFHTFIRAAKDVVRDQLASGASSTANPARTAAINIPTTTAGCDGAQPACRDLTVTPTNEGSSIGGPSATYGGTGIANPDWTTLSHTTYRDMIMSGSTGVQPLSLSFVQSGVKAIEILRRPAGEAPTSALGESRLYNQAQIRVLLSDDPAELSPGGALDANNIRLANVGLYATGVPVPGAANTYFAEGTTAGPGGETNWLAPIAVPAAYATMPATVPQAPAYAAGPPTKWNLLDGYLRVETRRADGSYVAVTQEWLQLGFARRANIPGASATLVGVGGNEAGHPNAILLLQQQADRDLNGVTTADLTKDAAANSYVRGTLTRTNWYPINFYEAREGELRENATATASCHVGGVMNVVEIDVKNLQRWLNGTIGATGTLTEQVSQNGYVLYFSDRRGMLPNPNAGNVKNGEYGFEDVINPNVAAGTPNGVLDTGENVSGRAPALGVDVWGKWNLGYGIGAGNSQDPNKVVDCKTVARKNWVSGARHAVRLVNGTQGNLPVRSDVGHVGTGGFTLATENPAYIFGDYNANLANCSNCADLLQWDFTGNHAASAVIADTVSLLSNGWTDLESFTSPASVNAIAGPPSVPGRGATTTYYRVAIASGKNMNFPIPTWGGAPTVPRDFGTDGGVHNFLRYLENWGGNRAYYKGSMVSLYYSQYATGVFKCCNTVYSPPTRYYSFDVDFLDITKLPPGTPKFRDVVDVGFQQVF